MSEIIKDNLSTPDKNLGKNILFQIYFRGAWYDSLTDELMAYTFPTSEEGSENPSTIVVKRINGKVYTWTKMTEDTPETTDGLRKMGVVPAENTAGELDEIVYTVTTEDDQTVTTFYQCTAIANDYTVLTGAAVIKPEDEIEVTITPNSTLKTNHPYANVTVDGNEYTLGYLSNPIVFNMNRDHRISIAWIPGTLVETFRFIATR